MCGRAPERILSWLPGAWRRLQQTLGPGTNLDKELTMSASGPQILAAESRWQSFQVEAAREQWVAQMIHDNPSAFSPEMIRRATLWTTALTSVKRSTRRAHYLLICLATTTFRREIVSH